MHADFRFHPWMSRFLSSLPDSGRQDLPRRFFIARAPGVAHRDGANKRICDNAEEIASHLAKRDIPSIYPERLQWPDQIALFRNARLIIGEFGSGLHNAIFSGPGARVLCLGFMNYVQSTISAFRLQRMAFVGPSREFDDEEGLRHLTFDPEAIDLALRALKSAERPAAVAPAAVSRPGARRRARRAKA